jgi:predicted ATPase
MRGYALSPEAMAGATRIGPGSVLESNGANAGDVLRAIEGSVAHRWVDRHLAALTPGVVGVRTALLLGRRALSFTQEGDGRRRVFDASQVSQGTLRGLGVLLALRQEPAPAAVFVDEIEGSVHPSALGVLLDAAVASAERLRVVLTTHSPEVLDHPSATGDRLRVVEWQDGASSVYRLNAETRDAVSELETVGSMLRSNALWPEERPERWSGDMLSLGGRD